MYILIFKILKRSYFKNKKNLSYVTCICLNMYGLRNISSTISGLSRYQITPMKILESYICKLILRDTDCTVYVSTFIYTFVVSSPNEGSSSKAKHLR